MLWYTSNTIYIFFLPLFVLSLSMCLRDAHHHHLVSNEKSRNCEEEEERVVVLSFTTKMNEGPSSFSAKIILFSLSYIHLVLQFSFIHLFFASSLLSYFGFFFPICFQSQIKLLYYVYVTQQMLLFQGLSSSPKCFSQFSLRSSVILTQCISLQWIFKFFHTHGKKNKKKREKEEIWWENESGIDGKPNLWGIGIIVPLFIPLFGAQAVLLWIFKI
jgi:hypothetical protein